MYCDLAAFTALWYSARQLRRIWRDTWRRSFCHLRSARLQARLRLRVASLSHGVDCVLVRLALKGATESRMTVQVDENMERSSSALHTGLVPPVGLHRGESLKAAKKCPAVEGLIMRETRLEAVWVTPEHGTDTVNKIGE